MTRFSAAEALRIAALARLGLTEREAADLAPVLDGIATSFSGLAAYAETLPPAPQPPTAPLRADEATPASPLVVEAILRAAPRVDARANSIVSPHGRP